MRSQADLRKVHETCVQELAAPKIQLDYMSNDSIANLANVIDTVLVVMCKCIHTLCSCTHVLLYIGYVYAQHVKHALHRSCRCDGICLFAVKRAAGGNVVSRKSAKARVATLVPQDELLRALRHQTDTNETGSS